MKFLFIKYKHTRNISGLPQKSEHVSLFTVRFWRPCVFNGLHGCYANKMYGGCFGGAGICLIK